MNNRLKYMVSFILGLSIISVLWIHLAPVSFDGTGPGFQKWIADKYTVKLFETYLEESGYSADSNVKLLSSTEEGQAQIKMDNRKIFLSFTVRVEDTDKQVLFEGKRYWIEKYAWHLKK